MAVSGLFKVSTVLSKELTTGGKLQVLNITPADTEYSFGAGTDPDATAVFNEVLTLSSGSLSIDLTALAQSGGLAALDLTGKTIYGVRIKNLGANSMTFSQGATNGYPMFSLTPGHPVQSLGELVQVAPVVGFATVAGADKTIDVAGTGAQTFRLTIWAGTP